METFGSFQDLGNHVKNQLVEQTQAMKNDDGNVYHYIVEALKTGKPRGMDEIVAFVCSRGFEKAEIETAVNFMRNNNVVSCSEAAPIVYWLTIPYSQLRDTPRRIATGYAPRKTKVEPMAYIKPANSVINKNDNLDVAIFKVMQDHKPRSASEIAKILVEFHFDATIVKNRVITLMKRKTWFDRKERGGQDTLYVLKKSRVTAEEKAENVTSQTQKDVVAETPQSIEDLKGTVFYKENNAPKINVGEKTIPEVITAPILPTTSSDSEDKDTKVNKAYVVKTDDPVQVAIWKIVQDKQWYRVNDVIVLLQAGDHFSTPSTIRSAFSGLNQLGWFENKLSESGRGEKIYRLKGEVRHPRTKELMKKFVNAEVSDGKTIPKDNVIVQKEKKDKPVANATEVKTDVVNKGEQTPLFEFNIKLKGISFDLKEFQEVLEFIKSTVSSTSASLIEVQYKIKGKEFTATELKQILESYNSMH